MLDMEKVFINHANKHFSHIEGIRKIQENFNLFGLVQNL